MAQSQLKAGNQAATFGIEKLIKVDMLSNLHQVGLAGVVRLVREWAGAEMGLIEGRLVLAVCQLSWTGARISGSITGPCI